MAVTKSPSSKRSPGRTRKSTVNKIEKSLERPSDHVLKGFEGVAFLFLLGAIAAVVAWIVYVAKFNIDFYKNVDNSKTVAQNIAQGDISLKNALTVEQYTICYQAVVSAVLLYFAFKYHFAH